MQIFAVGMYLVLHHLVSAKSVPACNPTWILIKWKMEANIFKMRLIYFPFDL
jgi:hypothetical protein